MSAWPWASRRGQVSPWTTRASTPNRRQPQEELRQASRAKDDFLGIVSHELRTPITTIYGGARLLGARRDQLSTENADELISDIEQESERLYRLVQNLLVLARSERTRWRRSRWRCDS